MVKNKVHIILFDKSHLEKIVYWENYSSFWKDQCACFHILCYNYYLVTQWAKTWKNCNLSGQCTICLKGNVFWKSSSGAAPKEPAEWEFFLENVDLVFEVIVQPPEHTFQIPLFLGISSLWITTTSTYLDSTAGQVDMWCKVDRCIYQVWKSLTWDLLGLWESALTKYTES